jgi:hypothetical protein
MVSSTRRIISTRQQEKRLLTVCHFSLQTMVLLGGSFGLGVPSAAAGGEGLDNPLGALEGAFVERGVIVVIVLFSCSSLAAV